MSVAYDYDKWNLLHVLANEEGFAEGSDEDEDDLEVVCLLNDPFKNIADYLEPEAGEVFGILVEPSRDEVKEEEAGQREAVVLGALVDV